MAFYTYVLRCSDGSYYTGHTEDLEVRLAQHQRGILPGYTHDRRPVELMWCQDFPERDEARAAERRVKGWTRAKKEALFAGDWERVSLLARGRSNREAPSTGADRKGPSTSSGQSGGVGLGSDREGPSTGSGQPGVGGLFLTPHPILPPLAVAVIEVDALLAHGPSVLSWRVTGGALAEQPPAAPVRTDGLWQTTCFELFVKPVGAEAYFEFNFAASGAWAAYRLDGYRSGMAALPLDAPVIERLSDGVRISVDLGGLPSGAWLMGLSAVIEEADGTKSYWALAHGEGQPDFHDPACFVLELPAPSGT